MNVEWKTWIWIWIYIFQCFESHLNVWRDLVLDLVPLIPFQNLFNNSKRTWLASQTKSQMASDCGFAHPHTHWLYCTIFFAPEKIWRENCPKDIPKVGNANGLPWWCPFLAPLPNFPVYHRILEFCHLVGRGFFSPAFKKIGSQRICKRWITLLYSDGNVRKKGYIKNKMSNTVNA